MKQAEEELQPWTLSFRARAKRFDFKFKYSKTFLISKFSRLSIRFKLRPFTVEFESKPESPFSFKRKLLDLKFLPKFKKFLPKFKCFRRRRSGNKGIVKNGLAFENYLCGRRGICARLWVMLFAVASFFVILQLRSYFTKIFWNFLSMVWNYSPLSGILHQYFKVIFDGIFRSLGF